MNDNKSNLDKPLFEGVWVKEIDGEQYVKTCDFIEKLTDHQIEILKLKNKLDSFKQPEGEE